MWELIGYRSLKQEILHTGVARDYLRTIVMVY